MDLGHQPEVRRPPPQYRGPCSGPEEGRMSACGCGSQPIPASWRVSFPAMGYGKCGHGRSLPIQDRLPAFAPDVHYARGHRQNKKAATPLCSATHAVGIFNLAFDSVGLQQLDDAGSRTTNYAWNHEHQMTRVIKRDGSRVTMVYNANFRRTQERI